MEKKVKIVKGAETKYIFENELPIYIAMGWKEVKDFANPFNKIK